jgi:filamentous hemagglutinin
MNKLRYRIIFNKARGQYMAVQETARTDSKGTGQSRAANVPVPALGGIQSALRQMTSTIVAAFGLFSMACGVASAQVIADPSASGHQRATILSTANDVLQVNVQTPSAAGVSRNTYIQFDVPKSGAILNNSRVNVQTQIGGWVQANPWMAEGSARVILNEVNSSKASELRGFIEVAGPRAETIIANPAGIVVDGGGFINVSRATLTTGTPIVNNGVLDGYVVQRGQISVQGAGLDASQTDYTGLIARSIAVNAGVWAKQLAITTGANQVSADNGAATARSSVGDTPSYGLDVSQLGGMYANKIILVGTEAGVGVRNAGNLGAAGDVIVTTEGRLENSGSMQAQAAMQIKAESLQNSGQITGGTEALLSLHNDVNNSGGTIQAPRIELSAATGGINNAQGKIVQTGSGGLDVSALTFTNTQGGLLGAPEPLPGTGNASGAGSSTGTGESTGNPSASTGTDSSTAPSVPSSPTTSATPPISTANGIVRTAAAIDNSAGIITAAGGTNLSVGGLDNSGGKLTLDSLSVDGQAFSNRLGTVTVRHGFNAHATSFANTGGTVLVGDGFAAQMDQFDNVNGLLQADHWQITVGQGMDNTHGTLRFTGNQTGLLSVGGELNNESGALEAASDLQLTAGSITGSGGKLNTLGDLKLNSGATSARAATWTIGGNAELHTAELENSGIISAGKDLSISSAALNNSGGKLSAGANIVIDAGGALDNTHGYIQAGKGLLLSTAGALNNSGGVLESIGAVSTMTIQAQAIDNNAGRISNAGTGLTHVSSNNSIDNNGLIAGNGNVSISAQALINRTAGMIVAAGNLALGVHAQLDNAGLINSGGTLDFRETNAIFKNSGQTVAGATATISVAAINNDGGQIATAAGSNGDLLLSAQSLSNNAGTISADRHAVLAIGGNVTNNGGLIRSVGNMDLQANGALVNNKGTIEATGSASGMLVKAENIDNTAGRIVNAGAGSSSVSAQNSLVNSGLIAGNGTLAISAQTVRNDGAGVIASGKDMELAARQQLDNAGTISSAATLNFNQNAAVLNNSGNIVTAGNITLAAARLNNDGGKIATSKDTLADMVLSAQNLSNQGGAIIIDRNVTLTIGGAVDNRGGVLQAGKNLQLAASGALDNSAGSIETLDAGSTLDVHALAIQNNAGRIVNVGTGASNIRSDSSIDNSGLIAGNGGLDVQANTLQNNAGGTVSAGGSLELGVTQQLNNRATISSGGTLHMSQAGAALDNSGQIVSGGDATIAVGTIKNDGGQIATVKNSGAGILLSGSSLSNRGGSILSDYKATLNMSGAIDNSAGQVQANGDLQLSAGGILTNNAGAIEAIAASSTLNVQGQSIANNAGRIANVGSGAMSVSSNSSVTSSGTIAGNGNLVLAAQTVQNQVGGMIGAGGNLSLAVQQQFVNQGAVNSAGTLSFNQAGASFSNSGKIAANGTLNIVAATVNNDGGQISTANGFGADVTLNSQSLSNRSGQVLADGNATVTVGGAVDNSQGTLQARKDMTLALGAGLQNNGGTIEALGAVSTLTLHAQTIDNGSGRISNVGSGATTVTSQSGLSNAGTIAGSGDLLINTLTLQNLAGGTIASGRNLDLGVTQQLSNQGKINAAGTLSFNQASANFTNSGQILSGGAATIAANIVNNDGGQLGTSQGSAADLALTSQTLSNQGGHIVADRDLAVTIHAMQGTGELFGGRDLSLTMDGDYTQGGGTQQFHSNRDLSLTVTGNITNTATFEAVRNLALSGNTITNQAGAVIRAQGIALKASSNLSNAGEINGKNTVTLTAANIDNSGAIVGGDLTLTTQNLNNTGAQALVGSTNSMALWVANQLNNTGGATIYSAGGVSIGANPAGASTAVVNNNSSTIEAAGNLNLAAATLNNIRDNVTLVKVTTVDETRHMTMPSWYSYGGNHNFYEPSSSNYLPHEVYFVNPQDILENATYVTPDGYTIGRAVIRTHANDSAFFIASAGLYSSYGHRERMQMSDGTRVLYYTSAASNLVNPDQGGSPDVAWPWYGAGTNWDAPAPTFSNQYGSCTTDCIRLTTQPGYTDPTSTIIRDTMQMLAPLLDKLEASRDAHHTAVEDRLDPSAGKSAQILSGGNMHLTVAQTLNNQYGDIMATGSLAIDGGANISNQGATLYRTHTFDGTWTTLGGDVAAFNNPSISEAIGSAAGTISGGKGVSISGRSFTNVDVSAGTVGNIRDAVNVIGSGATAAGPSGYGVAGNALNHAVASGAAAASGVGTDAQIAGKAGDSGTPGMTMRAQGSARGSSIGLGAQAINAASSGGNTVRISPSGLFVKNPDANGRYLLETRPQFANQGDWISSDYLLKQLGIDPAMTQKRLGDGFYEQRLVREQLAELTGRAPADGASDDSRYQQLLTNATSYAQQWNLRPGIALTPDQVRQLTSDIVWLVSETVSLPDGSTETVLVPKVYLAHLGAEAVKPNGALVTGDGVDIRTDDIVNRGGVIDGGNGRTVLVAKQDIVNMGGSISGGTVALMAGRDVKNETLRVQETFTNPTTNGSFTSLSNQAAITSGGALTIAAGRDVADLAGKITAGNASISAGRDISFGTVQTGSIYHAEAGGFTVNNSSITHQSSQISSAGGLSVQAGQDLSLSGTQVAIATGGSGDGVFSAGRNLAIGAVTNEVNIDQRSVPGTVQYEKNIHQDQTVVGSRIDFGGNLNLLAGTAQQGALTLTASTASGAGDLALAASGNVTIQEAAENHLYDMASHRESKGFLRRSSSTTADYGASSLAVGSTLSGNTVSILSGGDVLVRGSALAATDDLTLTAAGNVRLLAAQNTSDESHAHEEKKSGLMGGGGLSIMIGSRQQSGNSDATSTEAVASIVGSTDGDVRIRAGQNYTQTGSQVMALAGDVGIAAQKVDINAAFDTANSVEQQRFQQSGLSVGLSSPVISALQTAAHMASAAGKTSDPRMQALAAATAALAAKNAYDAVTDPTAAASVRLSLTLGNSKSGSKQTQDSMTAVGSTIAAGNNVSIIATGTGRSSDITVIGSSIKAGNDVTLKADGDILLQAAQNTSALQNDGKSSSAGVGVYVSVGANTGFGLTANASAARGNADGNDVIWSNTHVEAGNTLMLASGNDTTLKGAVASGKQVIVDVGTSGSGNLNIESLQDTSDFRSKDKSAGGSISVGLGTQPVSGSVSFGKGNIDSRYASVTEQSGIQAREGGFQVKVEGNTDLKGGVIASGSKAVEEGKNSLATQTLTRSDIQNKADYKGSSVSLGASYSTDTVKNADGTDKKDSNGDPVKVGYNGVNAVLPGVAIAKGHAESVTASGISGGAIVIMDEAKQKELTGQNTEQTVAGLNRETSSAENSLKPIFNEKEVKAGFAIVISLSREVGVFMDNRAREADAAKEQVKVKEKEVAAVVNAPEATPEQKATAQYELYALKQDAIAVANWAPGGDYYKALNILTAALSGNVTGSTSQLAQAVAVNYLQTLGAEQVKQLALGAGIQEGSAVHAALHAVVGCAGAVAGNQNCAAGATGAAASAVLNGLLSDPQDGLTSEEKAARKNLVTSIVAAVATGTGKGADGTATKAATIESIGNADGMMCAINPNQPMCGGFVQIPSDPKQQKELLSVAISGLPLIGQAKAIADAILAKDVITGEDLNTLQRVLNGVAGLTAVATAKALVRDVKAAQSVGVNTGLKAAEGVVASRVNVRTGDANVTGSGLEYAWKKHGGTWGENKSAFTISKDGLRTALQDPLVVNTPAYQSATSGNYIRTVDMGRTIGIDAKAGGQSTNFLTVITDSQGNLVNTFPGKTF